MRRIQIIQRYASGNINGIPGYSALLLDRGYHHLSGLGKDQGNDSNSSSAMLENDASNIIRDAHERNLLVYYNAQLFSAPHNQGEHS